MAQANNRNKYTNNSNYSKMETTVFYVAVAYSGGFNPTVVEKFDNKNRRRQLCGSYVPRKATPVYLYSSK